MARLPQSGQDAGVWGEILNEYLLVSHADDGDLKASTIATKHLLADSVTEAKLNPDVRAKLNATAEVQIRKSGSDLEWRTSASSSWEHLVTLLDITGPQGPQGIQGVDGPQGLKGDTGDDGIQGIPGIPGPQGEAGAQGVQGAKGDKGDTGNQGPQGEVGPAGAQGAAGPGVATGGSTGQVLSKSSGTNYATQWSDVTSLLPSSQITTLTSATGDGSSAFADAFRIIKITASAACRIRFYRSSANRTSDMGRAYTTVPPTDGTLLAEFRWESPATFWTSGFTSNLDAGQNTVYWRIDDGTATVTIEWVKESR